VALVWSLWPSTIPKLWMFFCFVLVIAAHQPIG
jgi:hypothetical protein